MNTTDTQTPVWRCDCGLWTDGPHAWGSLAEATSGGRVLDYERKHPCPVCRDGRRSPALNLIEMRKAHGPRRRFLRPGIDC